MDDKRLNRLEDKLDHISEKIGSIDTTLAAQHVSLKEHMRRTSLLEEDMKPIKKHVHHVHGALKLIGLIATIAGIIEIVFQLVK